MATALTISLWIAQGLLAAMFLMAGFTKNKDPAAYLKMTGNPSMSHGMVRFIGTSELLGAIAIVLPAAIDVAAWLTPLAAIGLATIMVLATGFHMRRSEWKTVPMTVILLGLAVFVAVGRWDLF